MKKYIIAILCLQILYGCSKDDTMSGNDNTNFTIKPTISNTGNGVVEFVASAPNTKEYIFEFGDGNKATSADGVVSHSYTKIGNNTFPVTVTAVGNSGTSLMKTTLIQVNVTSNIPGLVWSDEFNVSGAPDASKWTFEIGRGNNGWGNNELQYYTNRPQNASVQNGVLRITAIKENFSGAAYTSARLITRDKFDFKYGRVEVRAKLPAGGGTWPAAWMLGTDIGTVGWPACGEIDIMEHKGNEPNKIHGSLHYPGRSGGNPVTNTTTITNATTEFHVYKLEWTADQIRISVDDKAYLTVVNNLGLPFNKNFFCLLNVAMGGTFGGNVDPNFNSASMEVDYIRVFSN